jgi:ketosteroid isomerase-like protein
MGKTTFSDLEARPLTPGLAIVTGRFQLQRDAQSGGEKSGLFTLVMRKGAAGWRIIHDHTSADN